MTRQDVTRPGVLSTPGLIAAPVGRVPGLVGSLFAHSRRIGLETPYQGVLRWQYPGVPTTETRPTAQLPKLALTAPAAHPLTCDVSASKDLC